MKPRNLTTDAEPNTETTKKIGMKIFSLGGLHGANRRELFKVIRRLPDRDASYAWMIQRNLISEHPLDPNKGYNTPFVVELTDAGRVFIERNPGANLRLPPVAYQVDRELYAKIAVMAVMRDQEPEELLTQVLTEATKDLNTILFDAAKKNRPELF